MGQPTVLISRGLESRNQSINLWNHNGCPKSIQTLIDLFVKSGSNQLDEQALCNLIELYNECRRSHRVPYHNMPYLTERRIKKGESLAMLLGLNNNEPWRMTRMGQILAVVGARHSYDLQCCQCDKGEDTIMQSSIEPVPQVAAVLLQPQQAVPLLHLKVDELS